MSKTLTTSFKKASLLFSSLLFSSLLFSSLLFSSIVLIPNCLLAQRIDIRNGPDYTVAGNGGVDGTVTNVWDGPWSEFIADSSNNTLVIHSTVSNSIFGGINYPFTNPSVAAGDPVTLKPAINVDSNTIIIYNYNTYIHDPQNSEPHWDLRRNVYGAFSILERAIYTVIPDGNIIDSPISLSNNSVQIDSYTTNIWELYGASLNLNAHYYTQTPITINSSLSLDNNKIILNSSCSVAHIRDAYLGLRESAYCDYNIPYISLSSNSITISTNQLTNCDQISVAYLDFSSDNPADLHAHVENLHMTNNKISFSAAASNLNMPNTAVYGIAIDNVQKVNVVNKDVQNNMIELNSAKNITLQSILGFDSFSFNLPTDISNNETLITLTHQRQDLPVDAHKLFIYNYDHHTSTLTVNLIDASKTGYGYVIDLSNTNGAYLYDHTRTQLQVRDKRLLIFTFDPSISPTDLSLNSQTTVISGAASSNLAFLAQGLDLVIDKAIDSAKYLSVKSHSWAPFAVVDAAKSKFFIGHNSDLDINGFSVIAGIAKNLPILDHNFTFA
ncbi:MAG: hypothetical protein LBP57_02500, partial [Endomicrobium sp.]|nr:hypothetical protein [Endomicrobium sp.]